jgi:hypothetical protein
MKSRRVLQNASYAGYHIGNPTIRIVEGDSMWEDAYSNWLDGKSPTDSADWELGVFLHFEPIEELPIVEKQSWLMSIPGTNFVSTACKIVIVLGGLWIIWALTTLYWIFINR